MTTAITNVRLFDGETVHTAQTVLINDGVISAVGPASSLHVPQRATIVEGSNCTLLPGLIDAHSHTSESSLKLALKFGVTTELEMGGHWTAARRTAVEENDSVADLRTAGAQMTPPGGHPAELMRWIVKIVQSDTEEIPEEIKQWIPKTEESHTHDHSHGPGIDVSTPEEAEAHVARCVESGSDYIKVMIEDGHVVGEPGLPVLSDPTLKAGVAAAHKHGKMAIAHALTYDSTVQALDAGVDGLAHLFIDRTADKDIVAHFKANNTFVTACACLNASTMGLRCPLLDDDRVMSRLPPPWSKTLAGSFNTYPQGTFNHVLQSIKTLHDAGVDVLVGTDASIPLSSFGGVAHGASVHYELQLFVQAGLTPVEALKAATSLTAKRFGLVDRGRVAVGLRADLLLVGGDPTVRIGESLNIKGVWRRGRRLQE